MKFCGNCGTQLPDEALVCSNCGVKLDAPATETAPAAAGAGVAVAGVVDKAKSFVGKLDMKRLLPVLIGGVAVILVVVLLAVLLGGSGGAMTKPIGYELEKYMGEFKNLRKTKPDAVWEEIEDVKDVEDIDFEDKAEEYEETYEYYIDELEDEYGKGYKIKYKVTDKDELSEKKLSEWADRLCETYDDIKRKDVTAAYELEVDVTVKGPDDNKTESFDVTVVKISGKWYYMGGINIYDFLSEEE